MLFSVFSVVGGRPENTFMLFWIKKHLDHFFQLEITTKKGKKSFPPNFSFKAFKGLIEDSLQSDCTCFM